LVALRTEDFVPWLLACGDAVEVLEPAALRHEIHRIDRAVTARYAAGGSIPPGGDSPGSDAEPASPKHPS